VTESAKVAKTRRNKWAIAAVLPMYIFTLVFIVGPLIYMLMLSFMSKGEQWGASAALSWRNYERILEPVYLGTFGQSIKMALLTTFFVTVAGYPFGYFMARLGPVWRGRVMLLVIIPFWTSSIMRLYGWIIVFRANGALDSWLIALGLIEQPLKLLYTFQAVVIGMAYVLLPFMIYSVYSSAEKLDWSLLEAAKDLGASPLKAFFTISLPLTMPGLFSGIILTFIPSMGLYFIADLLGGNKIVLVGSLIHEQLMRTQNQPFAAALSVILMAVTTLFLYLYRRFTGSEKLEGLV
jgi:spermidine/putrescine transport system permease protein